MGRLAEWTAYRPADRAEQQRWLRAIVASVLVLNLIDAILTITWVSLGLAREANPVLARLIEDSPLLFVLAKLALVGGGSWLLWHHRRRPAAIVGIFAAFLAYYGILVYHLGYLSLLVRNSLPE